ncbi:MAG: helix-turn-helix transcriptional regulator, partial [Clostridiales bacterium]|nr:helix-turn-helix transcriptional regulator [Clostridiales bacterium]
AILNRDGDIVSFIGDASSSSIFDSIDIASSYYKQNIEDKEYIYQTVRSDYSGCSFVSIVPTSIFWSKLHTIRTYSIIVAITYILLGLLVVFLLSRHNYAPMSSLLEYISAKSEVSSSTNKYKSPSEIDFIKGIVDTSFNEKEQYSEIRQNEFLLQSLRGIYPKNNDIFDEFASQDLKLLSDEFVVMLFQLDSWDPSKINETYQYNQVLLMEPLIKDYLVELLGMEYKIFTTYNTLDTSIAIINFKHENSANIRLIAQDLQDMLKKNMDIIVTIAFSQRHSGWEGLEVALKQAEAAQEYRTIFGTGSILSYKELKDDSRFRYNFDSRGSAKHLISLSIMNGEPSSKDTIKKIREDSCSNGIHSIEEYRCYFYDMHHLLYKVTDTLGFGKETLNKLKYCETLQELERTLIDIVDELRELYKTQIVQQEDFKREKELCDQVMAYIEQNFTDVNLSVGLIGEQFNLTSAYLSRRFKDFTGMTIFEYLTQRRIEKAKELLSYTENTLDEISERVGFSSSATLIRVFKKLENITPGAFRQIYKESLD